MLTETARVVAVEAHSVWVETVRQSTCGSCSAQKGCGHGLLNQMKDGSRNYLQLSSADFPQRAFTVDDEVMIGIPEQLMLAGSFIVYLLPLLMMLLGAGVGSWFFAESGELASVVGAGLGLLAGVLLMRLHAQLNRNNGALAPKLLGLATQQPG